MSDASSNAEKPASLIPWSPVTGFLVSILVLVAGQAIAFELLRIIFVMSGVESLSDGWLTPTTVQFLLVILSYGLPLAAIWGFLRWHRVSVRVLGLLRSPAWKDLGYAVLGLLVYFGMLIVVMTLAGAFTGIDLEQKQELGFDNLMGSREKILAFISLVVLPPIAEEIIFRGFLFTSLRKRLRFIWAALATSLPFAFLHLFAVEEGAGLLWVAGIDTLVLSLVLCFLRERTGALWAPILVHALKNGVAFLYLIGGMAFLL